MINKYLIFILHLLHKKLAIYFYIIKISSDINQKETETMKGIVVKTEYGSASIGYSKKALKQFNIDILTGNIQIVCSNTDTIIQIDGDLDGEEKREKIKQELRKEIYNSWANSEVWGKVLDITFIDIYVNTSFEVPEDNTLNDCYD